MVSRIKNIGALQTGKMLGVLYLAMGVIFAPFFVIAGALGEGGLVPAIIMAVVMMVVYPIMGFIGGIIMAVIYNVTAGVIGGIEITLENSEEPV